MAIIVPACKTCRHWGGMPHGGYAAGWVAVCRGEGHDETSRSAFTVDDESNRAHLMTGPDFGCVKHEPKDAADQGDGA